MDPFRSTPVANKEHKCDGCREPITPGTRYFKFSVLWMYEGDVDDEGRSIAILVPESERKWCHQRYHLHHEEVAWL